MSDSEHTKEPKSNLLLRFLPVIGFIAVAIAFYFGLTRDDARTLPSTFISKSAPQTALPALLDSKDGFPADLADGKVKIVNIWASWCGPCRIEHPFLMQLAAEGVEIYGFNYKDTASQATNFLNDLGDPYTRVGADNSGRSGIEWGVYGVPESFVINGDGIIIYKHVGPIQNRDLDTKIRPALEHAENGQ